MLIVELSAIKSHTKISKTAVYERIFYAIKVCFKLID
jgi:hypothetical protein